MKKIVLTSLIATSLVLFSTSAKAEFYLGLDAIGSNANFKIKQNPAATQDYVYESNSGVNDTTVGGGINLGYKFRFNDYFIAPEYAYEYLNNRIGVTLHSRTNPNSKTNQQIQLEGRSILKLNIGKKINQNFDVFAFVGASYPTVELVDGSLFGDANLDSSIGASAIFGLGTYYNLNKDWAVKLAYDYQQIKVKASSFNTSFFSNTSYEIPATTIDLHTVKVGLVYNF